MKILKITYLVLSNFFIFYGIHSLFFSVKIPEILFNTLISLSCLNFVITLSINQSFNERKVWFITSQWLFSIILIYALTHFLSGKSETMLWISVIVISIIVGILTSLNFSKSFGIRINYKKYLLKLIIISVLLPLVSIIYFSLIYQIKFYDLSYFVFVPEILAVIIWQVFNYWELDFANKSSN